MRLSDWNRLYFVDPANADCILDALRGSGYKPILPADRRLKVIEVDGLPVLMITRGPDAEGIYTRQQWYEKAETE